MKILRKKSDLIKDMSETAYEIRNKILENYSKKLGLPNIKKPEQSYIEMPEDLSQISSQELGSLLTKFTAMCNYVSSVASLLDATLLVEESLLDNIENQFYIEYINQGCNSTEAKAKARVTPEYKKQQRLYLEAYTKNNLLKASLNNYERCISAISREISRRTNPGGVV